MSAFTPANIRRWRADPAAFMEEVLVDPETGQLFVLTPAERPFLRHAFQLGPDGRLLYPELVFSGPKKSGKTALGAMCLIYVVVVLGGRFAEGYAAANDYEQAQGRVFTAAARIVAASPLLAGDAIVTQSKIEFRATGAAITAIASDYAGSAGANPALTIFDELWGYTSERAHRFWDEMVPSPARKVSGRMTVTYAGFEGESDLLADVYKRGLRGEEIAPNLYAQPGMLMLWTHDFTAPWQTDEWREQMRQQLRPNAYLRQIENRFVTTESTFVELEWWDACVDAGAAPLLADKHLPVWVGVDASMKHDTTAIAACTYDRDAKKVRLVWHKIFQPTQSSPLDFENTIGVTVEGMAQRFALKAVRFDPWQMQAVSQRLTARRIPMVEFNQTIPNITEASTNLYDLIKGRNLVTYPDDELRLAVQRSIAVEVPRGWKITKEKSSHKIDIVVALGMAALGAVESASKPAPMKLSAEFMAHVRALPPRHRDRALQGSDFAGIDRYALWQRLGGR